MGYSLGDDRKSFDIYDNTREILVKIGEKLIDNGWYFNRENYSFIKNNRTLQLETSKDHITTLYLTDKSVDFEKFCKENYMYDIFHECDGSIGGVCFGVYGKIDIDKIVRDIEYAPLKRKDKEIEL